MQIELHELIAALNGKQQQPSTQAQHPSGQHIVVLDRGFVYVGTVSCSDQYVTIHDSKNIRVWGTSNGLGELRNGPLSGTKLDATGEVVAPLKSVIHFIKCSGF